jgi:hypothetical protein
MSQMLEAYDVPAILGTSDWVELCSNKADRDRFTPIDLSEKPNCFAISRGYKRS